MLSKHLINTDWLRKEPGGRRKEHCPGQWQEELWGSQETVFWRVAVLVQGRRHSPAPYHPQHTSRLQFTDVAVRYRAQVRVALPSRPKPHAALCSGRMWLPR